MLMGCWCNFLFLKWISISLQKKLSPRAEDSFLYIIKNLFLNT